MMRKDGQRGLQVPPYPYNKAKPPVTGRSRFVNLIKRVKCSQK